jgi:hypothetical protein
MRVSSWSWRPSTILTVGPSNIEVTSRKSSRCLTRLLPASPRPTRRQLTIKVAARTAYVNTFVMALAADQRQGICREGQVASARGTFTIPGPIHPATRDEPGVCRSRGLSLVVAFVRLGPSVAVRRFETRASVTASADGGAIQKIGTQ